MQQIQHTKAHLLKHQTTENAMKLQVQMNCGGQSAPDGTLKHLELPWSRCYHAEAQKLLVD